MAAGGCSVTQCRLRSISIIAGILGDSADLEGVSEAPWRCQGLGLCPGGMNKTGSPGCGCPEGPCGWQWHLLGSD